MITPSADLFGRTLAAAGEIRHARWISADRNIGVNKTPETVPMSSAEATGAGHVNADLAAERAPGDRQPGEDMAARQEQLLDEGIEETYPASDPVAVKRII